MKNLISRILASAASLFGGQVKQLLSVVFVAFLLLISNVNPNTTTQKLDQAVHQNTSQRPKTVGEWKQEARETRGATGERTQRIAGESAEAVKEFGSLYPDTAKRSGDALKNDVKQPGKGLFGQ